MRLDKFDHAILNVVQRDNQLTHAEIGSEVGLSNSAVRRRLMLLRRQGIIARDVSLLTGDSLGVTVIIDITFALDTPKAYAEFDQKMCDDPTVKQVYHVAGTIDYVLIVQGPSLEWYEAWAKEALMSDENLQRHDTRIVYSCKKFETSRELK